MRLSPNNPLAARAKPAVVRPFREVEKELASAPMMVISNDDPKAKAKRLSVAHQLAAHGMDFDEALSAAAINTSNTREHRTVRADRSKRVRAAMYRRARKWLALHPLRSLLTVTVTRVAPRMLDEHDGLRTALKPHVDGIAAALRIDDASPLVEWRYLQRKGPEAVEFTIEAP